MTIPTVGLLPLRSVCAKLAGKELNELLRDEWLILNFNEGLKKIKMKIYALIKKFKKEPR
jgi:hypothetical protein